MQVLAEGLEELDDILAVVYLDVRDRLEADLLEPVGGLRTHPEDLPHGDRCQEDDDLVRRDDREPVRLLKVRGDLCDRFRRSDPDGTGEAMPVADRALNLPREILCVREAAAGTNRDIEEALLDSTRLQPVREPGEGEAMRPLMGGVGDNRLGRGVGRESGAVVLRTRRTSAPHPSGSRRRTRRSRPST